MHKKKSKWLIVQLFILIIIIAGALVGVYFRQKHSALPAPPPEEDKVEEPVAEVCLARRKIDGVCFDGKDEPLVYAVMIDNHAEADPVAGLGQASLVYEAIVEAPITRYLAIFSSSENIKKIGPVRSARPFFLDWAREFDCPYAHVGGSPAALNIISTIGMFDLNEFYNGQYFWRDSRRLAPHNVFTSDELLLQAVEGKKWKVKNNFEPWPFKDNAPANLRGEKQTIKVKFINDKVVEWQYDKNANDYARIINGEKIKDSDKAEIHANNVAVMLTDGQTIDSYGRRKVKTVGSGKAIVFLDGQKIEGRWQRPDIKSRTRFFDANGIEIAFNAGKSWIEVIEEDLGGVEK